MSPLERIVNCSQTRRNFTDCLCDFYYSALHEFFWDNGPNLPSPEDGGPIFQEFDDNCIVTCKGVYTKPAKISAIELERALNNELPETFKEIYEVFGTVVLVTRTAPIQLLEIQTMIDDYEDHLDIDESVGRFFRFAQYIDFPLFFGLRQEPGQMEWSVVCTTHGMLYSEMIGDQGRGTIIAASFESWLSTLIETDGYPDPNSPLGYYSQSMEDNA